MKKWITALLALVLALTISAPALAAEGEFDPTVTLTQGTNSITVTLVSTDSNNAILAARKPALSVPCGSRTVVSVTAPNGSSLTFTQEDGLVRFTVEQGGAYVIALRPVSSGSNPSGGSSAPANPTVNTETTTTPDGSTVKTETKQDGTVVESTKSPDGSTTTTESKTETKADGSTVETKKETVTASDGSTSTTETKVETKADGSSTETRTESTKTSDGTKTETKTESKTDQNGVTSTTEVKKTTVADGSTSTTTTTTDENGSRTESSVRVSSEAVKEAQKSGEAVTVPVEVPAGKGEESSSTVSVNVPSGSGTVKVEIPVSNVSSGTVIVLVHEDGTEELVKATHQTETGVQFTVEGNVTVKIVDNSKEFSDTMGHWSEDEVNYAAARELFNGIGGGKFGIADETTCGMAMTVLARLAGVDTDGDGAWYEKGVKWAEENNISDGRDANSTLTREQLAVMLYRYSGSPEVSGELNFDDANEVSDWAKDAMLWATQAGIIGGNGDGTVTPGGSAQRAQVAAMFTRFLRLAM